VAGDKAGGVAGSPSDPANKQFLDPATNSVTKKNFVSNAPRNPQPSVSIAKSPEEAAKRILTGRFSEVDELRDLADEATKRTKPGLRTNSALRGLIKKDPKLRSALSSVGINPDTLKAENPSGKPQFPSSGSVNLSKVDADVNPVTGEGVPGPNTDAALARRAAAKPPPPTTPPEAPESSPGAQAPAEPPAGTGPSGLGSAITTAGRTATEVTRATVPGVAEAESALVGGAYLASSSSLTAPLVTPLMTAAEGVPIVGGSVVVGATVGNLAEAGAKAMGASKEVAEGTGALSAMASGAAIGALIGAPTGIGAPVGAVVGAVAGLGGYYLSKYL
jgi:hypothetical protein